MIKLSPYGTTNPIIFYMCYRHSYTMRTRLYIVYNAHYMISLQFMVMSFTTKRLLIYDKEEDMENGPGPITTLEFSQIYTVRTLRAGEHETFRVKQSDLKKILVVRNTVRE